jgi:hypothetical protein
MQRINKNGKLNCTFNFSLAYRPVATGISPFWLAEESVEGLSLQLCNRNSIEFKDCVA